MRPGRSWVSAPTGNDDTNLALVDEIQHPHCLLAQHGDVLTREVLALAFNAGEIAADVTVTCIPPVDVYGNAAPPRVVRIEPGKRLQLALTRGVVRLESTQPIVPGGETRVIHKGTVDVLTRLFSAAPLVWFELTPKRVERPPVTPDPRTPPVVR